MYSARAAATTSILPRRASGGVTRHVLARQVQCIRAGYTDSLTEQPFRRVGDNVKIYKMAVIVSPETMVLGSDIIIDDFVFIGSHQRLILGNHVHIASHASITGGGRVLVSDFSGISSGARLISGTDDFTDDGLTGPTIPPQFRQVHRGTI